MTGATTTDGSNGRFVVFEGIDGCGKSTQARRVGALLGALVTFEPGDTELGRALRDVLLAPGRTLAPVAELLVLAADRAQHLDEVVVPALRAGHDVVCDRYNGSTLAYQGFGRGLDLGTIHRVLSAATEGREPDVTILLDCPVEVGRARRVGRGIAPDRFDEADAGFLERVRAGFLELAATTRGWHVVDATADGDAVAGAVDRIVAAALG